MIQESSVFSDPDLRYSPTLWKERTNPKSRQSSKQPRASRIIRKVKPNEKESGKDMQNKGRLKSLKRTRSINRGRKGDRLRGIKKSSATHIYTWFGKPSWAASRRSLSALSCCRSRSEKKWIYDPNPNWVLQFAQLSQVTLFKSSKTTLFCVTSHFS